MLSHRIERLRETTTPGAPGEEEVNPALQRRDGRAIVRAHGGTLSVTSNEESGTHFTARLPLDSNHLDQNTGNGRAQ